MECTFPSVSLPDGCMWWHLPVIAAAALTWLCLVFSYLSTLCKRHKEHLRKRRETVLDELHNLELEMWDDEAGAWEQFTSRLQPLGVRASEVAVKVQEIKKQQSERAGVSLRYLLSDEFSSLAQTRAEKANPTFNELKDVFWLGEAPLGKDIICPRDGRPGCALVDSIPRKDRREQTHFMSWSWQYTLEQVCISLDMFRWIADSADASMIEYATFFFMDFFVNNQYRIFGESAKCNLLHEPFQHCLQRVGRMVVLLDDAWQDPAYFKRVWTVYEFHVALLKNVNVQLLLNHTSFSSLYEKIRNEAFATGNCLFSQVDCSRAIDALPQDKEFVHSSIRQTWGFDALNREARRHLQEMVQKVKSRDSPKLRNWLSSVDRVFAELEVQLWDDEAGAWEQFTSRLQPLGVRASEVAVKVQEIKKQQSERAGVSLRYLLSDEFSSLAQTRAEKANPTFNELKDVFWLGEAPLGEDIICPRDGRPGCALVDWIPRKDRREQTHFMSWSWQYTLAEVQSALEAFRSTRTCAADVGLYFYMCFFVNNQFRIVVERSAAGSENLSNMFQQSLLRTGHMVAILDNWQNPVYLTRVWTIYEQFLACSQGLEVTLVMPEASMNSLQGQIFKGREGIRDIIVSLSQVDSASAEAWDPKDATRVKSEIQRTVGFDEVNRHVVRAMVCWIGRVVQRQFQQLVDEEMISNIEEDLVCDRV